MCNCNESNNRGRSSNNLYNLAPEIRISTEYSYVSHLSLFAKNSDKYTVCKLPNAQTTLLFSKLFVSYLTDLVNLYKNKACLEFIETAKKLDTYSLLKEIVLNKPTIIKYREFIIFYSLLLCSETLDQAYNSYFQVEKRCAIRDYWQWLSYEQPSEYKASETVKLLNFIVTEDKPIIIPEIYFDPETFSLQDFGFDPKDGIWKSLPYNRLESQRGDVLFNYNPLTCCFFKIQNKEDIYKKFKEASSDFEKSLLVHQPNFHAEEAAVYFAILPPHLATYIKNLFLHLYYFFRPDHSFEAHLQGFLNSTPLFKRNLVDVLKDDVAATALKELVSAYTIDKKTRLSPY
jgi:hypothetical protein